MDELKRPAAAVIGTGFIGAVHIGALRRLGVPIAGVLGSSAKRGAERAAELGVGRAYASLEEVLNDPAVRVVHVTSPNHAHYDQVKQILAAGRHVICEKPLAMTSDQSREMVQIAAKSRVVAAVCYNIRFYPLNQQARGMVASGDLGNIRFVHGHFHQDWLAKDTDWNWRLESDQGGVLRSVGDIGTHWIDLTNFITGQRPAAVMAELTTFIPERNQPTGPVETFSNRTGGPSIKRKIETDDTAMILLRYPDGARGTMSTSQISFGRKGDLFWEISGSRASAAWQAETPDHMWIGHRDAPNQILLRDPSLMNPQGIAASSLPGGHVEGFADSFHAFFRQVYRDVAKGGRQPDSAWASFEDGHFEMLFCDAVLKSAQSGEWARIADA